MDPSEITRIKDPAQPDRCQSITPNGQCINVAVPGGKNCLVHGGNKQLAAASAAAVRNFRLGLWQARVEEKADSSILKSLNEEVGILRILLEERLTLCRDNMDLLLHSNAIADLILKIEKVVGSCHKLEASLGQHLDKGQLLQFSAQIVSILGEHIKDQETLDAITASIIETLK